MLHMRIFPFWLLGAMLLVAACGTSEPTAVANRPGGEGYAGVGERLVQIRVPSDSGHWWQVEPKAKRERASVEISYVGLDSAGRAVFQRHDIDALAGAPVLDKSAGAAGGEGTGLAANTRQIVLDLRLSRQIRVQGKIIEIIEATSSGVVYHLY